MLVTSNNGGLFFANLSITTEYFPTKQYKERKPVVLFETTLKLANRKKQVKTILAYAVKIVY